MTDIKAPDGEMFMLTLLNQSQLPSNFRLNHSMLS